MSDKTYFDQFFPGLAKAQQETFARLGEEKGGHFVNIANDAIDISGAVLGTYRPEIQKLVLLRFFGMLKEVRWFHLFFLAGNYALLNARLRFVWESMFRAFWADHDPTISGLSLDDKAALLRKREKNLGWDSCIAPTLRQMFPLAAKEQQVLDDYHELWKRLNEYVHPSMNVTDKLLDPQGLLVLDGFHEEWALETLELGTGVFDLAWLAVLRTFPKAWDKLDGLSVDYPILSLSFDSVPAR
jgi:hypothetical protein